MAPAKIASLIAALFLLTATGREAASVAFVPHRRPPAQRTRPPPLLSSSDDSENAGSSSSSGSDDLRRLLEASWNSPSMGRVPTTPARAAEACAGALRQAMDDRKNSSAGGGGGGVYLVDLRLPQYDISAGTNLYDEVLAVEFCAALSAHLPGRSEILVRDQNVLATVARVLRAREGGGGSSSTTSPVPPAPIQPKPAAEQPETKSPPAPPTQVEDTEFFDDFADFGTIGGGDSDDPSPPASSSVESDDFPSSKEDSKPSVESTSDVDSFRAQLDRTFYSSDSLASSSEIAGEERVLDEASPPTEAPAVDEKRYRLASLLGDATKISNGPDMVDDVAAAVSAHAKPTETEDSIIILSPVTAQEMIAIRALVGHYKATKTIVLVNCQLEPPLPRELIGAETVYSILPLIAKPTGNNRNGNGNNNAAERREDAAPKVVVLRRYPRDWEVYVDVGRGFDLAASVPDGSVPGKQGPAMEWVSSAVKRYLQSRL